MLWELNGFPFLFPFGVGCGSLHRFDLLCFGPSEGGPLLGLVVQRPSMGRSEFHMWHLGCGSFEATFYLQELVSAEMETEAQEAETFFSPTSRVAV